MLSLLSALILKAQTLSKTRENCDNRRPESHEISKNFRAFFDSLIGKRMSFKRILNTSSTAHYWLSYDDLHKRVKMFMTFLKVLSNGIYVVNQCVCRGRNCQWKFHTDFLQNSTSISECLSLKALFVYFERLIGHSVHWSFNRVYIILTEVLLSCGSNSSLGKLPLCKILLGRADTDLSRGRIIKVCDWEDFLNYKNSPLWFHLQ